MPNAKQLQERSEATTVERIRNVYLDVDGVILANESHAANYVHEFLELVTNSSFR